MSLPRLVDKRLLIVEKPIIDLNMPKSLGSGIKVASEKFGTIVNSIGLPDSIKQNIPDPPFIWNNIPGGGKSFIRPLFWNLFGVLILVLILYYLWTLASNTHQQRIMDLLDSYSPNTNEEETFDPRLIKPYNYFSDK